jgi:hypothetical protein
MNVPRRLNHRRRVVYAALRKALDRDQRIPKLFIFWNRNFSSLDHFVISPYIEQAASKGWLNDQEKRELTRSLMYFMSHDYQELPEYPDEFINLKPRNPLVQEVPASPRVESPLKITPVISEVPVIRDTPVAKEVTDSSATLKQVRSSSIRKVTVTPEMMPHYLVFREVMSILLKTLKDSGRSSDDVRNLVFGLAAELNLIDLEPLLQPWSEQGFSLEELPILIEQPTTQLLVQLFYQVACELSKPPASKASLVDRVKTTEIPEIVR